MSNLGNLGVTDCLTLGKQLVLPTETVSLTGGVGLLAGPIFAGQPAPAVFTATRQSAVINIVPSPTSVPGGSALNISGAGLGALDPVPYPGTGLSVNATVNIIAATQASIFTVSAGSIRAVTPTTEWYTNEIHVGTVSQSGAKAESGAKADAGARAEAGAAAQNASTSVAGALSVGGVISCAWLEAQLTAAKASPPKGFDMHHPTKPGWRLTHICLEGPEAAVYHRGILQDSNTIELPDYWKGLVDSETITVHLTPIRTHQELHYELIDWGTKIKVVNNSGSSIHCSYIIYGERKDVDKIVVEYEGKIEDYPGRDQRSIVGYHYDYRPGVNS